MPTPVKCRAQGYADATLAEERTGLPNFSANTGSQPPKNTKYYALMSQWALAGGLFDEVLPTRALIVLISYGDSSVQLVRW
jgi:hypothetical protein